MWLTLDVVPLSEKLYVTLRPKGGGMGPYMDDEILLIIFLLFLLSGKFHMDNLDIEIVKEILAFTLNSKSNCDHTLIISEFDGLGIFVVQAYNKKGELGKCTLFKNLIIKMDSLLFIVS